MIKKAHYMKKIIAAFDGLKYSQATTDYAIQCATDSHAHLVGVFLDDMTHHTYKLYDVVHSEASDLEKKIERYHQEEVDLRKDATEKFEISCRNACLNHSIHHDRNIALHDIIHESVYADMLVISGKETFTAFEEQLPTRFIKYLLTHIECPLMVVPERYRQIEKVVFLFDGEPSSVYAIKMFSYLFPNWGDMPVEVVTVKEVDESLHLPDGRLMKEFLKRHYPHAVYTVIKGLPDIEIVNHVKNRNQDELIVLGAYHRGKVSRLFKPSMVDVLMQDISLPLFIVKDRRL